MFEQKAPLGDAFPMMLFCAGLMTFFATESVITAVGDTRDFVRWGVLYGVAVIMPWVFLFVQRRKGVEERLAVAPLLCSLITLRIASEIMANPEDRWEPSPGFLWGLAITVTVIVVMVLLQKFRLIGDR